MIGILNIYEKNNVPKMLQKHMLIVAAVGKYIIDHWQGPAIDEQAVITTLLVHDLGNLVKFDLAEGAKVLDPTLFTDEWRERQEKLRAKYGRNSHQATLLLLKELGIPKKIKQLATKLDASNVCQIAQDSLEQQICEYADMHVVPSGVTTLEGRLQDLRERYSHYPGWDNEVSFQQNADCAKQIEDTLQQYTSVDILQIPPEKIEALLVELLEFEIQTN